MKPWSFFKIPTEICQNCVECVIINCYYPGAKKNIVYLFPAKHDVLSFGNRTFKIIRRHFGRNETITSDKRYITPDRPRTRQLSGIQNYVLSRNCEQIDRNKSALRGRSHKTYCFEVYVYDEHKLCPGAQHPSFRKPPTLAILSHQ